MLYFFLSYASGDNDEFVAQFFDDLSKEVRDRAGLSRDVEVGFLDIHSIELGAPWSRRLVSALSTCRSFLALCSPRYFLSEACGKEWAVFAGRLSDYEETTGDQPATLMPVLWVPVRRMPAVAQARQFSVQALGEEYRRDGLRQLMRLQRHRDAYLQSVSVLAGEIVNRADSCEMPASRGPLDFERVTSTFANIENVSTGSASPSQYVHFVLATGNRRDMAAVRRDLRFYGDRSLDWAPYRPALAKPIAEVARGIATEERFQSEVVEIGELAARMDAAAENNQIVVLIVDSWATRLDHHRRALVACNDRDARQPDARTAVMVPASNDDRETQEHWPNLSSTVLDIFAHRARNGDARMFRFHILNPGWFDTDLRVALHRAQNRVFEKGAVRQPAPPVAVPPQPILNLPDAPGGRD